MHASTFVVIPGSTRPNRRSPTIAKWVADIGERAVGASFRIVDLRDLGLQLDDESGIPAIHGYAQGTTCAWGDIIANARGVVIVTPQYNWGYPAVLKNAIDHLYREWQEKPVLIVTYGGHGGTQCGEQLRSVLRAIGARLTEATPALTISREMVIANDGRIDPELVFTDKAKDVVEALQELVKLASPNSSELP